MSLQSALIGFLISRLLPIPLSAQEIIVVQTTAVATGTMPLAAGFVGIIPALKLLDEARDGSPPINLTWLAGIGWSCSVAFFGFVVNVLTGISLNIIPASSSLPQYGNKSYEVTPLDCVPVLIPL